MILPVRNLPQPKPMQLKQAPAPKTKKLMIDVEI